MDKRNSESGIALLPLIVLIILLLILAAVMPPNGGTPSTYSLSPATTTTPVGTTTTYTITVTLDAPAGLSILQQIGLIFSGTAPANETFEFDLVESDYSWDDTLHDDVVINVPWGATTATTTLPITCKAVDILEGATGVFSDSEPTHTLRVEGWGDVLPVHSSESSHTCTAAVPGTGITPPATGGATTGGTGGVVQQCTGTCGTVRAEVDLSINGACPEPCTFSAANNFMRAAVRMVESAAAATVDQQCPGENCHCGIHTSSTTISNCRQTEDKCFYDVTVNYQGNCMRN